MAHNLAKILDGKIIDVWAVYETVDERGRRGQIVAVAKTKTHADTMAEGKGWYGGVGDVVKRRALSIDGEHILMLEIDTPIPLDTNLPGLRKQKIDEALAKLTPEEQVLLGLDKGVR